jgi:hypothetical protein
MRKLVERSPEFLRTMPWAVPDVNDGKGPFERSEMDAPDFAVIHGEYISPCTKRRSDDSPVLAFACNTVWEATNTNLVSLPYGMLILSAAKSSSTMSMAQTTGPRISFSSIE